MPLSDGGRVSSGEARAGRRRLGAREGGALDGLSRWECLSKLGPDPIRLSPANTTIAMAVRWMGGLTVRGTFAELRGTIHAPVGDASTGAVTVEVDADSVRTGIALRDRHLRGPLFLDAAQHPVIAFRGGDVLRLPGHFAVAGSLTIRGVTRTEEIRCTLGGTVARELSAAVTVSRRAYDVGVPRGLRRLDPLFAVIGDEVRISIRITL